MFSQFTVLRGVAAFVLLAATSAGALAQSQSAATSTPAASQAQRNLAAIAAERGQAQRLLLKSAAAVAGDNAVRGAVTPGTSQNSAPSEVAANTYRAYPPSCLSDPLPSTASGPVYSAVVPLAAYNGSNTLIIENVTISVWRVACVSLTNQAASATLMRIQRQAELDTQYPLFPGVRMAQASSGVGFDDSQFRDYIRTSLEPNTVVSGILADDPVVNSTTYVLEYYPSDLYNVQNYNNAFSLRFDNFFAGGQTFLSPVPTYAPTAATYPAAFQPMQVSGYQSGNYVTTLDAENMLVQIYQSPTNAAQRILLFTWVAYDTDGLALNMEGNQVFNIGDTSVTSPLVVVGDHGVQSGIWGNVTFTFTDCNTINFTYNNTTGGPGPSGSGTRTWLRLASLYLNGLTCQ